MAKNRNTKKYGPSKRPPKRRSTTKSIEQQEIKQKRIVEIILDIDQENRRRKSEEAYLKIKASYEKGRLNEKRFENIFSGDFKRPSWFVGIRKAGVFEDRNEGTDFFIKTTNYGDIRFNVKSSFHYFDKQKESQKDLPIFAWCVVINDFFSDEEIRKIVFDKCAIHIVRLKREVSLGRFISA